jgi:hypothetical protein
MSPHSLFVWLISQQAVVLFSQNKPVMSNQSVVLFSQIKPAPTINHQPNEQASDSLWHVYGRQWAQVFSCLAGSSGATTV